MKKSSKKNSVILVLVVFLCFCNCSCFVNNTTTNLGQVNNQSIPTLNSVKQIDDSSIKNVSQIKKKPKPEKYIQPGYGTERVFIGMSRENLLNTLGEPSDEYSHDGYCVFTQMHWYPTANADGTVDGEGIFAFLLNETVFELRFGEGYYTKEGIEYNLTLKNLKTKITAPLYLLFPSANTATNNEHLIFMVETENGIAYELGVGYKSKKRVLNAIYVFSPSSNFLPWGCLSENQTFTKITDETPFQ